MNTVIVFADNAFQRMTGFSATAVIGKACRELLLGPDTDTKVLSAIDTAMAEGQPFTAEVQIKRKAGEPLWTQLRIVPSREHDSQLLSHYIWLLLDTDEQKRTQTELSIQRTELAKVSQLAAIGEVGAALTHELSQPLSAIVGNASAALNTAIQCPRTDCHNIEILQDICGEVRRLRKIFDHIRSLSQPSDQVKRLLDVDELAAETLRLAQPQANAKRISIRTVIAPGAKQIYADRVQIQQVLLNLLANAFDAFDQSPEASRLVVIHTRNLKHAKGVELKVSDRGTGIPPDVMPQLFGWRITTKASGMGIGLRLCRTIIQAHNGTLTAENNKGPGATFCVTLPTGEEAEK